METKFTKGKWTIAKSGVVMQGYSQPIAIAETGSANIIAGVFGDVSGGLETANANAKLIAAAPELLEIVTDLVRNMEKMGAKESSSDIFRRAKQAIAKATK